MKKTINTSSVEYFASFFGAIFLAFGLGAMFAIYFEKFALIFVILGLVLHTFGMYKMYK